MVYILTQANFIVNTFFIICIAKFLLGDANCKKPNCPYFEEVTKPEPKQISIYKKLKGIENSIKYITETLKEITIKKEQTALLFYLFLFLKNW